MFKKNGFNFITINGRKINCSGRTLVVDNGKVFVDGKVVEDDVMGNIQIIVHGDVENIQCAGSVTVNGNATNVDCGGNCDVTGNIQGDVDAGGNIHCKNVMGDVDAGGNVKLQR